MGLLMFVTTAFFNSLFVLRSNLMLLCDHFSDSHELGYRCFAIRVLLILFRLSLVCLLPHCRPVMFSLFVSVMHPVVCPKALADIVSSLQWLYLPGFCPPTNRASR